MKFLGQLAVGVIIRFAFTGIAATVPVVASRLGVAAGIAVVAALIVAETWLVGRGASK